MKSFGSDTVLFKHRFAQSELVALVPCGQRDSFHQTALVPSATLHWGNKQKPRRLQPEEKKATETHSLSHEFIQSANIDGTYSEASSGERKELSVTFYLRNSKFNGKDRQVKT